MGAKKEPLLGVGDVVCRHTLQAVRLSCCYVGGELLLGGVMLFVIDIVCNVACYLSEMPFIDSTYPEANSLFKTARY